MHLISSVLFLISYQAIAFPLQNRAGKKPRIITLILPILGIWAFALIMPLSFVRYSEPEARNATELSPFFQGICQIIATPVKASHHHPYFSLVTMVSLPFLLGVCFSLLTIYSITRSGIVGEGNTCQAEKVRRRKLKSIFMILIIITLFATCWLPITLFYTWERLMYFVRKECDYNYNAYAWFSTLLMAEFAANPIVYWFMNADFRKGVKLCLTCRK